MSVVVGSNLFVTAANSEERGLAIRRRLREWRRSGEAFYSPWPFRYEVANALARNVVQGETTKTAADDAWADVERRARRVAFHDIITTHA